MVHDPDFFVRLFGLTKVGFQPGEKIVAAGGRHGSAAVLEAGGMVFVGEEDGIQDEDANAGDAGKGDIVAA